MFSGIIIIIRIGSDIYKADDVRELLINGINLQFKPSKNVCLLLGNGYVVKLPELLSTDDNTHLYKVKSSLLRSPLNGYSWIDSIETVTVNFGSYKRTFFSEINWPEFNCTIDLATDSEIVASTLNKLSDIYKDDINITKAQRREIVKLIELHENDSIDARIKKTLEILKNAEEGNITFDSYFSDILNTTPVMREKEEHIRAAVDTAVKQLELQRKDLYKEIESLKKEKQSIIESINLLESKRTVLMQENEKNINVGKKIITTIEQQVKKATSDASELIANISIMRPFINSNINKDENDSSVDFIPSQTIASQVITSYNDCHQLIEQMAFNIKELGISMNSAKMIARYFTAIKLAGLIPLVLQSDSREFALAVSAAIVGKTPLIIPSTMQISSGIEFRKRILGKIESSELNLVLLEDAFPNGNESGLITLLRDVMYINRMKSIGMNINIDERLCQNTFILSCDNTSISLPYISGLWEHTIAVNYGSYVSRFTDGKLNGLKLGIVDIDDWSKWYQPLIKSEEIDELFENINDKGVVLSSSIKKNIYKLFVCLVKLGSDKNEALKLIITNHLIFIAKCFGWSEQLIEILSEMAIIDDIKSIQNTLAS